MSLMYQNIFLKKQLFKRALISLDGRDV